MKCTKIYNARAIPLFRSLNLLCRGVLVAASVVICVRSLPATVLCAISGCSLVAAELRFLTIGQFYFRSTGSKHHFSDKDEYEGETREKRHRRRRSRSRSRDRSRRSRSREKRSRSRDRERHRRR